MAQKRTWLAFANEDICNHRKALKELKFVNWTTNIKSKFAINDSQTMQRYMQKNRLAQVLIGLL